MSTKLDKTTTAALPELAADANREHAHCKAAFSDAVEHALTAGRLLLEAKVAVVHGEWLPWIEQNFDGGARTAQGYMRLAKDSANAQRLAHLGIAGALRELSAPREATASGVPVDEVERMAELDLIAERERPFDADPHEAIIELNRRCEEASRTGDTDALRAVVDEAGKWQLWGASQKVRAERELGRLGQLLCDPDVVMTGPSVGLPDGVVFRETGLELPDDLPYEDWLRVGMFLKTVIPDDLNDEHPRRKTTKRAGVNS